MKKEKTKESKVKDHEDASLKVAAQYFGDVMLPYFGIEGEVVSYGPTEIVHLEVRKQYEDFNFIMKDGRWIHFEFQSTNEGKEGLKRFREYEASTSNQYGVEVITYVLFSGKIKNPMIEFTEGINTYRVKPIIMKGSNADEVIENIQRKLESGETLTREDLFPLLLCPLMSGKSSQKDRMSAAYKLTREAVEVDENEIKKMQAVLYVMADKFLKGKELEEFKEEVKMTRLGQMLVEDGRAEGRAEAVCSLVKFGKKCKITKEEIIETVMNDFSFTREEAEQSIEKYW